VTSRTYSSAGWVSDQVSGGETPVPSQVNLLGMVPPSANSGLEMERVAGAVGRFGDSDSSPAVEQADSARLRAARVAATVRCGTPIA
jgi:hypothetical protein